MWLSIVALDKIIENAEYHHFSPQKYTSDNKKFDTNLRGMLHLQCDCYINNEFHTLHVLIRNYNSIYEPIINNKLDSYYYHLFESIIDNNIYSNIQLKII